MTLVRAATTADATVVAGLEAAVFGAQAWSTTAVAEEIAAQGTTRGVLVADATGMPAVGYASWAAAGDATDLRRIAVQPEHRRRGVASALLDATLASGSAVPGCHRCLLEVAADNAAALAFYQRHGFTAITRRPRYYGDIDAVVMERPLAQ